MRNELGDQQMVDTVSQAKVPDSIVGRNLSAEWDNLLHSGVQMNTAHWRVSGETTTTVNSNEHSPNCKKQCKHRNTHNFREFAVQWTNRTTASEDEKTRQQEIKKKALMTFVMIMKSTKRGIVDVECAVVEKHQRWPTLKEKTSKVLNRLQSSMCHQSILHCA